MILLDATVQLTDQGFLAFCALLLLVFGHMYSRLGTVHEKTIRLETMFESYLSSQERNRRGRVVTSNPFSHAEEAALDLVTADDPAEPPTRETFELARDALYREGHDAHVPKDRRDAYLDMLPVIDARLAMLDFDQGRQNKPFWKRVVSGVLGS